MFGAPGGMALACLVLAYPVAAGAPPAAAPAAVTQGEAGAPPEDSARARALLDELRAAAPLREGFTTHPLAGRSRLEVGRDMLALDRAAVPLLVTALDDPDGEVSAVAALALGQIGDARAADPMLKVLEPWVPESKDRGAAAILPLKVVACVCALGRLQEARAAAPILILSRRGAATSPLIAELGFQESRGEYMCGIMLLVSRFAIRRMGFAAAPELVRRLSDPDVEVRRMAVDFLGRFGAYGDGSAFWRLAAAERRPEDWPEANKQREALRQDVTLSDRVAALAGARLIEMLHEDEWGMRGDAARALGDLRVASAVGPLIESLKDKHPWVRTDAIASLGKIGDPVAVDVLRPLLKRPGPDQGGSVEYALARIGGPRALAILRSRLEDADPDGRKATVEALSLMGTPEAADLQIATLKDTSGMVRLAVARALGALRAPLAARAVEPLIAAVRDDADESVCTAALDGLGYIGDPRGLDVALEATKAPSPRVRAKAVGTVGLLKDPKSVGRVKEMLADREWLVRMFAVAALSRLAPPDLVEALQPMLKDEHAEVRREAQSALNAAAKRAAESAKGSPASPH